MAAAALIENNLIRVFVLDHYSSSTVLKITESTLAKEICANLATKVTFATHYNMLYVL